MFVVGIFSDTHVEICCKLVSLTWTCINNQKGLFFSSEHCSLVGYILNSDSVVIWIVSYVYCLHLYYYLLIALKGKSKWHFLFCDYDSALAVDGARGIMFLGCPSVCACVCLRRVHMCVCSFPGRDILQPVFDQHVFSLNFFHTKWRDWLGGNVSEITYFVSSAT